MIFDTHCHLNSEELYPSIKENICAANKVGVSNFLVVGYNKETSLLAIKIAQEFSCCYAAIGFHPTEIFDITWDEMLEVLNLAKSNDKVVAIGEIGLDYHWIKDDLQREKQREIFIKQIDFANKIGKPVCIHNRDSNEDCFAIIKEHQSVNGFVMHCYSGSVETMKEIVKMDKAYISLGGPVTFTNAKVPKEVAKEVPLNRLLVETDSPYLSPHPLRGTINKPENIPLIVKEIADLKMCSIEEIEQRTYENACKVFGIK